MRLFRSRQAWLGLLLIACALLPALIKSPYALHLFILVFLTVMLGESWNIIGGFGGQYSVGHAAYFGIGAYTSMILLRDHQIPPWFGVWAGMAIAVAVALVIGAICFRLRGPYFVLASIAVAEIMRNGALNWKGLTNGAEGILAEVPPFVLGPLHIDFVGKVPYFYLGLILAVMSIVANALVRVSKLGYYLQAVREDQDAAHSLGIPIALTKNTGLAISAALTALGGGFYALYTGFIDPAGVLGIDVSIQLVLVCIIGGIGTVAGPILGAVVLVVLSEALRSNLLASALFAVGVPQGSAIGQFLKTNLAQAHVLVYGILVVVTVLFMPDGFLGFFRAIVSRRKRAEANS